MGTEAGGASGGGERATASEERTLPDERGGLVMIFRAFEKMSYGLVLSADRPLAVNDVVKNP